MVYLSRPWTPAMNPFYIGPYPRCAVCPCDFDIYKGYTPGGWHSQCYHSY
ncbi:uncharacterized protein [Drosophila suzukii]|uniref:Uncharacterized protein LOC108013121 n=1 Tax=Drosophila suzukii TaxID=28584 RepID=A0AB39ZEZ5_DROSZ|nr:uncharacterized protein LOC108013121 [Drosophila suzukii]XP_036668612.1 uncharacterized protein LOC108013121 [Drosophila suzukii]XP_037711221.1 uncharacterized protein LOC119548178 [Drosophila subpulchrella]